MSFVTRQVAHCDKCGHEWLTEITPSHCARCKSRQWNNLGNMQTACVSPVYEPPTFVDTMRQPPKPASEQFVQVDCGKRPLPPVDRTPSYYVPAKYKKGIK